MAAAAPEDRLEDRDLMIRVQAGDVRAFEAIDARYRAQALQLAHRITGSSRLAEEATQDPFLSLWRSAPRYDTKRGALKTWLLAMVRNRSIDCLRREGRHHANVHIDEAPSRWLEAAERTDEWVHTQDEAARTRQLVLGLPPAQRKVIELTYFDGLTQTEVARQVGIPLGTVKGRQRLGLERLHQGLVVAFPGRA